MMRWKDVVLMAFMLLPFPLAAQLIRGRVMSDNQPLAMANVMLYASADTLRPAVFITTDSTGTFVAVPPKAGNYLLRIQLIGFEPFSKLLSLSEAGQADIGIIVMKMSGNTLQEVTVTAKKKLIQRNNTGFTVETDAILTQAAGTATDLLANIPTVLVDGEGGISIRGKSPMILINGRNSNLGANLERIPASSIERIEIINNPGAKYDADAEGGIINIILKKNAQKGTNGAFAIGGGYGARERFNSSLLLNHREGNTNLGLSYDNRMGRRTRAVNTDRETFAADDDHYLYQDRFDERKELTHNLKLNADHTTKRKDQFSFEGIYGYDNDWNYETLMSNFKDRANTFTEGNQRISDERQLEHNWEGSMNYVRKYANERKQLSAGLSHSYGNESENTLITTTPLNAMAELIGDDFLQKTSNRERTHITTGRLDMSWPLSSRTTLDAGYKGIYRNVNANFQNAYEENGAFVVDPVYSNVFVFSEHIHAMYGNLKSTAGPDEEWKYEAGLRLEQMNNNGESDKASSAFSNRFFNIFPNLNISRRLNEGSLIKLNLGRRINRPWLGQLNPFIDITDSLNRYGGNPNLKPELVNTAEIGWGKDWNHLSLNGNLFYRRGTNTILPYTQLLPGGIAFTQPRNIGSSTSVGLEAFITTNFGRVWNSTASISMFNQHIEGEVDGDNLNSSVFSWYTKWVNNFNIGKNTKAQVLINYQAPTAIPQGTRIEVYNVDFGMQQKIMKGRGRVGLTVTDVFNTLENGSEINTEDFTIKRLTKSDTRVVLLTFAMTFGTAFKEKLMENKFSAE
jgi:outer membrane receptor protein involved in Fe transport